MSPAAAVREWASPLRSNGKLIFLQSLLTLLVLWAIVAYVFNYADTISSPTLVAAYMYELLETGRWIPHMEATLRRTLYGFAATMVIGTLLGIVMGMSRFWEVALQDYITVGLAFPALFAVVFPAMWFGVSDLTPLVAAAIASFPFVTQSVYKGIHDIDSGLVKMTSSFGVSRRRFVRRAVIPSVLPEWFAGARYSFAICWKIVTLAELVAAENGLGFMIQRQMDFLSLTGVISWTLLFTLVIGVLEYGVLQQIEKRVFAWRTETEISMGVGG